MQFSPNYLITMTAHIAVTDTVFDTAVRITTEVSHELVVVIYIPLHTTTTGWLDLTTVGVDYQRPRHWIPSGLIIRDLVTLDM